MRRLLLAGLVCIGACSIPQEHFFSGDGGSSGDDGGGSQIVTVGFAIATSIQDESSGDIEVVVRLDSPADENVGVQYEIGGGTAINGADYTATNDMLVFAPGETERTIPLHILVDGVEEQDETIGITLFDPSNNAMLGTATHTITISSALLPRATVMVASGSGAETASARVMIKLDIAPPVECTVTVAAKAGGTASSFDFTVPTAATVTFPVGSTMQMIDIPVSNDTADEDDETFIIELASSTGVVIGTAREYTHTINDDDSPPTVTMSGTSSAIEGNTGASTYTVTIVLTPASGKVVTVPVMYGGGTATKLVDYSYNNELPFTFTPNQNPAMSETQKSFTITVASDLTDELDQTIVTTLMTPTNATLGSPTSQTHTILDDDLPPSVQFMSANQSAAEGNSGVGSSSYFLMLSAASEKLIALNVMLSGSATYLADYTTTPAASSGMVSLGFPPGTSMVGIGVNVQGDPANEIDETVDMDILTTGMINVTPGAALHRTHTIIDDD